MTPFDAVRRQLLVDEQRAVFDAWADLACERLPTRQAVRPDAFVRMLPRISLLDVAQPERFRFRLAGTGVREVFGRDPTGRYLDEVLPDASAAYWTRAHRLVAHEGRPHCGAARAPRAEETSAVLLWLRLPLSQSGGVVDAILAYDHLVSSEEAATILRRRAAA